MTKKTNTEVAPYFDDYREEKGFLSILFRPKTVQVRELNQLQTILQNQISKMGDHVFKEGTIALRGGFQLVDQELSLNFTPSETTDINAINVYDKLYFRSPETNRRVLVSHISESGATDGTVMGSVVYPGSIDRNFNVGEEIVFETVDENGIALTIGSGVVKTVGKGSTASIESGVAYVRSYFVYFGSQEIVLSRDTQFQNGKIGLLISEDIITADQDSSLYSNATGEPNEKSEGANRFHIDLKLTVIDLDEDRDDFIELARVEAGNVSRPIRTTQYSLLNDNLARRTYEESGDYTVGRYDLEMRDHNEIFSEQNEEGKMIAVLGSGVSYVRGHRLENSNPVYLGVNKARDSKTKENNVLGINYGSYIELESTPNGIPEVGSGQRVEFFDENDAKVGDALLMAYKILPTPKIYVNDIKMVTGKQLTKDLKVNQIIGGSNGFEAVTKSSVIGADKRSLLFPLPVSGTLTLSPTGTENALYRVTRTFEIEFNAGQAVATTGSSEMTFDPDTTNFVVAKRETADGQPVAVSYTRGGAPTGTSLTINSEEDTISGTYFLLAKVITRSTTQRSKTLREVTETVTMNGTDTAQLQNPDGRELIQVIENGTDVTDEFTFDNGQRDNRYVRSSITSQFGVQPSRTLDVTYSYFQHGVGDYFSVDSYASLDRSVEYNYTDSSGETFNLREVVDFRPVLGEGDSGANFVYPDSTFVADIEYYLPRIDSLVVSNENGFKIIEGISAENPERPSVPNNSMRLFDIMIPAYTADVDDVVISEVDQQRYTMKDIGNLEKRISSLEYYTSLSTLEEDAMSIQAIDPVTGANRFKNGIFADPLADFRLMDPDLSDSSIDLESENGRMLPRMIQNAIDFELYTGGLEESGMVMPTYTEVKSVVQPYATGYINVNPYAVFSWEGFVNLSPSQDFWTETKYLTPKIINKTVNMRGSARPGVIYGNWRSAGRRTNVRSVTTVKFTESSTVDIKDNLVSTQVIPYMRGIKIRFSVTGMRPFTRVYPYFSGRKISEFCQQDGKSLGEEIITSPSGAVSGTFTVPTNEADKFRTGEATFVLVDNDQRPSDDPDEYTTYAEAPFASGGKLETRRKTRTTTRVLGFTKRTTNQYRRYDPVAQSFAVGSRGGEFLSSVDLFFFSKSDNIPVTLEIRGMENGLPTHEVLARKVLEPSTVFVSNDCTAPTNFKLDYPIFLEQDTEYAIVVLANTQDYQIGYCELGKKVINGSFAVAKQPNMGVMFTSANGSTWSPDQNRDLKFTLNRCKFSGQTEQITFRPGAGADFVPLGSNPLVGVEGEQKVTVTQPGHGHTVGQTITLRNSVGGLGLTESEINGERQVEEVIDHDTFTISVGGTLNESGVLYQPTDPRIEIKSNYMVSQFYPNIEVLEHDSVDTTFEYRHRTVSGVSPWLPLGIKNVNYVTQEGKFVDPEDFEIRMTTTTTDNIAPQVDLHGFTSVLNSYYVDTDQNKARYTYVTKPLFFTNSSTALDFFVNLLLPGFSTFKVWVQTLDDSEDSDWVEVSPENTIINDGLNNQEYQFHYESSEAFTGLRCKIEFYSDRVDVPIVSDIRGVAFA